MSWWTLTPWVQLIGWNQVIRLEEEEQVQHVCPGAAPGTKRLAGLVSVCVTRTSGVCSLSE